MRKFKFSILILLFSSLLAPGLASAKTPYRLFGYELGPNSYVIIEIKNNLHLNVWMQDPRLSSLPIHIGSGALGNELESVQLPKPDFMSPEALDGAEKLIDLSNSDNQLRNLKTDRLLVLTQRNKQGDRTVVTNELISLEKVLETQHKDDVKLTFLPPISPEFPHRRFQMFVTGDGEHLISVVDANDRGEARSLTFLHRNNWVGGESIYGQISLIDTPSFELNQLSGVVLSQDGKSLLNSEMLEIFPLGKSRTQDELAQEKTVLQKEYEPLHQRLHYSRQNSLIPGWESLSFSHPPKEEDYQMHLPNYRVLEFLKKNGKAVRSLSEAAYRQLTSPSTAGAPIAEWTPHQKLQVSNLGIMTYQDSPTRAILYLGVISKDNEPVGIHTHRDRLQITFENGDRADYDLKTGARFPNVAPFEAPPHKMCYFLFI